MSHPLAPAPALFNALITLVVFVRLLSLDSPGPWIVIHAVFRSLAPTQALSAEPSLECTGWFPGSLSAGVQPRWIQGTRRVDGVGVERLVCLLM